MNFVKFPAVKDYMSPYKGTQITTNTQQLDVEKREESRVASGGVMVRSAGLFDVVPIREYGICQNFDDIRSWIWV